MDVDNISQNYNVSQKSSSHYVVGGDRYDSCTPIATTLSRGFTAYTKLIFQACLSKNKLLE